MHRFWQVYLHLVWSTKNRAHIIRGELEKAAHAGIRECARDHGLVPVCVNSAWNHTHSLISWSPGLLIEDAVRKFKKAAADNWTAVAEERDLDAPKLEWQIGYSAFSVSYKNVDDIKDYIVKQKDHHRSGKIIADYEIWTPKTSGRKSA